ncbi:MAG TPA: hypothetical protein VMS77_06150 [Conexivisphaerales archaeon]|nr:hypothetical protein [Conexivisphaerales archaeon]
MKKKSHGKPDVDERKVTVDLAETLETIRFWYHKGVEAGKKSALHGRKYNFLLDDDPETKSHTQQMLDRAKLRPHEGPK